MVQATAFERKAKTDWERAKADELAGVRVERETNNEIAIATNKGPVRVPLNST